MIVARILGVWIGVCVVGGAFTAAIFGIELLPDLPVWPVYVVYAAVLVFGSYVVYKDELS